jgi:pyruvate/2-oxoglutarate/acetoin dehydrogenase E1 component
VMPTTPQDAYSLMRASIQDPDPVIFLEHRWSYDIVGTIDRSIKKPLGQAIVRRPGKDFSLICTSWMTVEALKAAEILARSGVDVEVVDVRSIFPLDEATILQSVAKTKRCLVVDYDWKFCGFSAEVVSIVQEQLFGQLKLPVKRLGFAHAPCPTTRPLENAFFAGAPHIIREVEMAMKLPPADLSGDEFYTYESRFKGPF